MSKPESTFPPVPRDTRQSANRILDADSPWRRLGEQMDSLFVICVLDNYKEELKENPILFLQKGMMTFLQWQEQLTDCQSAEASRSRIEWKYVLHLSLNHPGFQASTFCVFRQQLIASPSLQHLYQRLRCPHDLPPSQPRTPSQLCRRRQFSRTLTTYSECCRARMPTRSPNCRRSVACAGVNATGGSCARGVAIHALSAPTIHWVRVLSIAT
jgi:hypothetical protein